MEVTARQMTAIGSACIKVVAILPDMTDKIVEKNKKAIELQMGLAKNSVAWAMKSIAPLLLLFYIKTNMPETNG